MNRFLVILFLSFLLPVTAHAQCAMPSGPPVEAGVIVFNEDHKVMQYCNGDKWIGLWGGKGGGTNLPDCSDSEIMQWSGGAWTCNNGSGLDNLNAANLKSGTVPVDRLGSSGTRDNSTFLRGDNKWAAVLGPPPICSGEDKALQWNGSAWICANIEGGGGSFDLVNGQHTSAQCTGLGGTVVTDGSNNKFCRFNQADCPTGWTPYQNWTTYGSQSCGPSPVCPTVPTTCSTGERTWENSTVAPTCIYSRRSQNMINGQCQNPNINMDCTSSLITQRGCY